MIINTGTLDLKIAYLESTVREMSANGEQIAGTSDTVFGAEQSLACVHLHSADSACKQDPHYKHFFWSQSPWVLWSLCFLGSFLSHSRRMIQDWWFRLNTQGMNSLTTHTRASCKGHPCLVYFWFRLVRCLILYTSEECSLIHFNSQKCMKKHTIL